MRIFVTGGSGFIGSAFVIAAIEAGHEVTVLSRDPTPWRLAEVEGRYGLVEASLTDGALLKSALADTKPSVLVHLAWVGVSGQDRNSSIQVRNVGSSAELMIAAGEAGVTHFISTGSQAEYGPKSGLISPDALPAPTTLYGEAKLATGRILARLATLSEMRFSWLRVFSTYGGKDHPYWMIPGLIRSLLAGERPALTEGLQKWDFLHVSDAASALLAVAESSTASGVYNLGSGSAPQLRDTVSLIRDAIDPDLPLGFGDMPYRPDQVMHLQADISALTRDVDWRPKVKLADGLADTVAWYRSNRWIFA